MKTNSDKLRQKLADCLNERVGRFTKQSSIIARTGLKSAFVSNMTSILEDKGAVQKKGHQLFIIKRVEAGDMYADATPKKNEPITTWPLRYEKLFILGLGNHRKPGPRTVSDHHLANYIEASENWDETKWEMYKHKDELIKLARWIMRREDLVNMIVGGGALWRANNAG